MTKPRKGDHCIIDTRKQALVCGHCGSVMPITFGDLRAVGRILMVLFAAHKNCKPGDSPATWQSVPTVPVTTTGERK